MKLSERFRTILNSSEQLSPSQLQILIDDVEALEEKYYALEYLFAKTKCALNRCNDDMQMLKQLGSSKF